MVRIAIKSNADRQIVLCRDDRGFFLQTIHSDEKKPIEERVVTIGEAHIFWRNAPHVCVNRFEAVPHRPTMVYSKLKEDGQIESIPADRYHALNYPQGTI